MGWEGWLEGWLVWLRLEKLCLFVSWFYIYIYSIIPTKHTKTFILEGLLIVFTPYFFGGGLKKKQKPSIFSMEFSGGFEAFYMQKYDILGLRVGLFSL